MKTLEQSLKKRIKERKIGKQVNEYQLKMINQIKIKIIKIKIKMKKTLTLITFNKIKNSNQLINLNTNL